MDIKLDLRKDVSLGTCRSRESSRQLAANSTFNLQAEIDREIKERQQAQAFEPAHNGLHWWMITEQKTFIKAASLCLVMDEGYVDFTRRG